MAEFQKVVEENRRMCNTIGVCKDCPLGFAISCVHWAQNHPGEAEQIIMKWAEEHPIMTNRKKFEEVFGFDLLKRIVISEHDKEWFDSEYNNEEQHDII